MIGGQWYTRNPLETCHECLKSPGWDRHNVRPEQRILRRARIRLLALVKPQRVINLLAHPRGKIARPHRGRRKHTVAAAGAGWAAKLSRRVGCFCGNLAPMTPTSVSTRRVELSYGSWGNETTYVP